MNAHRKLLVVNLAAFSREIADRMSCIPGDMPLRTCASVFPAVTCTAQASFRTGTMPAQHGMIANGTYTDRLKKILFWEQASSLVDGLRIWDEFRARGNKVGIMFWQQSLGENADLIVSPRPIHKHSGGMIQDVYTTPRGLYDDLCKQVGRRFNLMNYWGPLTSRKSSDWIVDATCAVMDRQGLAPDLLLTYLPHLDYDLQRYGTTHPKVDRSIRVVETHLAKLYERARANNYDVLFFGDYAIQTVQHGAVLPNLALREAGLFPMQHVKGMAYPDFFSARAFAMVDHEAAHVYVPDATALNDAFDALSRLKGVEHILGPSKQKDWGIDHKHSGDFVLIAKEGYWFAYPWWTDKKEAPDFATHVDIHNKPGFDACELFFGWPPGSVSMDTSKVKGSHGRIGPGREVAWTSTVNFDESPTNLAELGRAIKSWLVP